MVGLSFDPGTRFYFHLLATVVGTLVVADILVEDFVHALGLVRSLHHRKNFHGSSALLRLNAPQHEASIIPLDVSFRA